jgi:uncharacterized protein YjbI with pentapeptide repeats
MQLVNATPWPFAVLPGRLRPTEATAACVVKASFALRPGGVAEPLAAPLPFLGDVYRDDDLQGECLHDADLAPFKPRTDLLLTAACHAPGGKPASVVRAAFSVGRWTKALAVIGPRAWRRGLLGASASDPEVFRSVPLRWENAFGGPGFARNPAGRGVAGDLLPLVEALDGRVTGPGDRPEPAGFGPISRFWPQRASKLGTYRGSWLQERWPWFPDDFDASYFNAAPADQQIPAYLQGDEELVFENLHPDHPVYRCTLPGVKLRAFLSERTPEGTRFREVPLNLDTLVADLEREQLSLVWRGGVAAASPELEEVLHAVCVQEPLAGPRVTLEQARALIPPAAPAPAPSAPPAAEKPDPMKVELEAALAGARRLEAAHLEAAAAQAAAAGFDLKSALARPPAGLAELRASLQKAREAYAAMGAPVPPLFDVQAALLAPGGKVEGGIAEMARLNAPKIPPPPPTAALLRQAASGPGGVGTRDYSGADFSGADLSGLDLSGALFRGTKFCKADLTGAVLADAQLGGADLAGAKLRGASLRKADLSGAVLPGADLEGAQLEGAILADVAGRGAVFAGAKGAGTVFVGASLEGARFEKAELPSADFTRARLTGASFAGAALAGAAFPGASLGEADFREAALGGAAFGGADLTRARLSKADAPGSIWESARLDGADFSAAKLPRAMFAGASMKAVKLSAADLKGAVFRKAVLQAAEAIRADAFESSFEKADLSGADFSGANLYGSEFWGAVLQGTRLQGADVKATKLE